MQAESKNLEPKKMMTPAEYMVLERQDEWKNELWDGEMIPATHPNMLHLSMMTNLIGVVHPQLSKRSEELLCSRMRIKVPPASYLYPDAIITTDQNMLEDNNETLLNPMVIIEVVMPETEACDRGKRFKFYRRLPSVKEYVLIIQDRMSIEVFQKQSNEKWLYLPTTELGEIVHLASLPCHLPLAEIYDGIKF
ncbi:MAG: Uma2 family endonuclease [Rhizobacter sp.]|nr:Uma2 family endonuclease [Chlorobiales bacterium]